MPLTASEIEELLRLALTALRGQAGAAPEMPAGLPAQANAGPALSDWLKTYRQVIAEGMRPEVVQTLLGHAHAEMTAIYLNDRGLTAGEWKTVQVDQIEG